MKDIFRQLYILMKKNMILRKNHYILTIVEMALPVLCSILIILLGSVISSSAKKIQHESFEPKRAQDLFKPSFDIAYAPITKKTKDITDKLSKHTSVNFLGFASEADMVDNYTTKFLHGKEAVSAFGFGIIFDEVGEDKLKYTLRGGSSQKYAASYLTSAFSTDSVLSQFSESYYSTYVGLQMLLDESYTEYVSSEAQKARLNKSETFAEPFPIPFYKYYPITNIQASQFTTLVMLSFIVYLPSLVAKIIQEKSSGMRELLKTMGLRNWVNYIAWFCNGYMLMFFLNFFLLIGFSISFSEDRPALLKHTNKFLLFIILNMYTITEVLFVMCISVFFNRAVFGVVFHVLFENFIGGLGYMLTAFKVFSNGQTAGKLATCLLPNSCLFWAMNILFQFESEGVGLQWDNVSQAVEAGGSFSMSKVMGMFVASWFIQIFIIWYFDAVWPWQKGIPRPLYFPFMKSYWCGSKLNDDIIVEDELQLKEFYESPPLDLQAGIEINNLTKEFVVGVKRHVAVNDISLKLYEGQVTALLGHNGAGKTTTISVITGMFPPTGGTVRVNGFDVQTSIQKARESMGYCPQENTFLPELTVKNHLELIATLKGYPSSKLKTEIEKITSQVDLEAKSDSPAGELSGGMKRRMSLGMALIGETKALLLDEPTSGLDPEARKEVWNIIQSVRKDKTVLLTTHYMEEADVLGDRIAIMSEGSIFCVGSALFLKNKFGAGYHLRMLKKDKCDVDRVMEFVKKTLGTKLERDSGKELSLLIEFKDTDKFPKLFSELEQNLDDLKIESFAVSVTNMEDVFLKVDEIVTKKNEQTEASNTNHDQQQNVPIERNRVIGLLKPSKYTTGIKLHLQQLLGLYLRRFHNDKRKISNFFMQFIIPTIVIALATILGNAITKSTSGKQDSVDMVLGQVYSGKNVLLQQNDSKISDIFKHKIAQQDCSVVQTNHLTDQVIEIANSSIYNYKYRYPIGAEINNSPNGTTLLTSLFNPFTPYGSLISANLISNTKLQSVHPDKSISISNHPLPVQMNLVFATISSTMNVVFYSIALLVMSSTCILFIVPERVSKIKHLQLMSGVHPFTFWLSNFAWDMTICNFSCLIFYIIIITTTDLGVSVETRGALFLLFLLYNWAAIPFSYLCSYLAKKPAFAFIAPIATSLIFCVVVGPASVQYTKVPVKTTVMKVFLNIDKVVKVLPAYSFSRATSAMSLPTALQSACKKYTKHCSEISIKSDFMICCTDFIVAKPFQMGDNGCGSEMLYLFCSGLFYILLLVLIESPLPRIIRLRFQNSTDVPVEELQNEDDEVMDEKMKMNDLTPDSASRYALVAQKLHKRFKTLTAVSNVSFGVLEEECFGLLGVNGAGKTTTFSMLTGDLDLTSGNAIAKSKYSVRNDIRKFQEQIGYCPQFNAHLEHLTGRELLYLFARLRGVPGNETKGLVSNLIEFVSLGKHADKKCGIYSGGNKRKLSIAMAIVGLPPLLFLDEPTTGIDPVSRRQIWNLLTEIKASGISIVLTSHSMEECEALCDRLTIMVSGKLQCIGSTLHLKNKFGQGYTIYLNMKYFYDQHDQNRLHYVVNTLQAKIPSAAIKATNLGMVTVHVKDPGETWARMFQVMEEIKAENYLENYAITATTLEEVFLSFANQS